MAAMTTPLKQSCYFCDQMERANFIVSYICILLYSVVPLNLRNRPKIDLRHAGTRSRCVFAANRRFARYDNTAAQSNE